MDPMTPLTQLSSGRFLSVRRIRRRSSSYSFLRGGLAVALLYRGGTQTSDCSPLFYLGVTNRRGECKEISPPLFSPPLIISPSPHLSLPFQDIRSPLAYGYPSDYVRRRCR